MSLEPEILCGREGKNRLLHGLKHFSSTHRGDIAPCPLVSNSILFVLGTLHAHFAAEFGFDEGV